MPFQVPNADEILSVILIRTSLCDEPGSTTLSSGRDTHFTVDRGSMLEIEYGRSLVERVFALPPGEQARCHIPRFALCANLANSRSLVVAICWECNNISVNDTGTFHWRTFDSQSRDAQDLLRDIQAHFSTPQTGIGSGTY